MIFLTPSEQIFVQQTAHDRAAYDDLVLICGRYEGIDHRVHLWCEKTYGLDYTTCSLGQYVTLGGEAPAMTIIEATARLLPGVIKEEASRQDESYRPKQGGSNIEHPHYTRPLEVEGIEVPEVLLSGHHAEIDAWKKNNMT